MWAWSIGSALSDAVIVIARDHAVVDVDCMDSNFCDVTCSDQAQCNIRCHGGSSDSCNVDCSDSAECLLDCETTGSCNMASCTSGNQIAENCADNTTYCGTDACPACGDNTVHPVFERCDDGNTVNGDGCNQICQPEALRALGDRIEVETEGTVGGFPMPLSAPGAVESLDAGGWIRFDALDMTDVGALAIRLAGCNSGGVIEVRRDSSTGPLVASYTMKKTPGTGAHCQFSYQKRTIPLTSTTSGMHDLYFVGQSGADIANIDYFDLLPASAIAQ